MTNPIRGTVNDGPIPMRPIAITNDGAVGEADSDLTDAPGAGTGTMVVARFPEKVAPIADQKKAAEARAKTSPKGGDETPQAYTAEVPFSSTKLSLGAASSAGGAGASLTTGGNVFIGATGKMGWQSVGAFTGQTKDVMGIFSVAGTSAHSQAKFEIFAGGGTAPGNCGSGGPAGTVPGAPPAEKAERITNIVCNSLGVVKGLNDIVQLKNGFEGVGEALTGLGDVAAKGYGVYAEAKGGDKEAAERRAKQLESAGGVLGLLGGLATLKHDPVGSLGVMLNGASTLSGAQGGTSVLNREGPVPGAAGAAALVPKTAPEGGGEGGGEGGKGEGGKGEGGKGEGGGGEGGGEGGGGPLDIEERAAGRIHKVCNIKVYGNAPEGIEWKTAGAFLVSAIAGVDFGTTVWGAFAAALFKVRAVGVIDVKCRKFEMKAWTKGKLKTPHTTIEAHESVLDGITKVTQTLVVERHTTLHDELLVKKNTLIEGKLTVKQKTLIKQKATFHKNCTFKGDVTVNGRYVGKSKLKIVNEGKLG